MGTPAPLNSTLLAKAADQQDKHRWTSVWTGRHINNKKRVAEMFLFKLISCLIKWERHI